MLKLYERIKRKYYSHKQQFKLKNKNQKNINILLSIFKLFLTNKSKSNKSKQQNKINIQQHNHIINTQSQIKQSKHQLSDTQQTLSSTINHSQIYHINPSIRGLINLGNTCYMNSALQCLHKIYEFTSALQRLSTQDSPIFIKLYIHLMQQISKNQSSPFSPRQIKDQIGRRNDIFAGYSQQDACQLFCTVINCIADDLNIVPKLTIHRFDPTNLTDQQLHREYVKKDHLRSKSIVDDFFVGRYLTIYECQVCKNKMRLFEKFHVVYLPVVPNKDQSLRDCMNNFRKTDELTGENSWYCKQCGDDTATDKTMSIYEANSILVICLKRFTERSKINKKIDFEREIDLTILSSNQQISYKRYALFGVINHRGSLRGGHYYSYCNDGISWKEYNDEQVREINENQIYTPAAFTLFYRIIN